MQILAYKYPITQEWANAGKTKTNNTRPIYEPIAGEYTTSTGTNGVVWNYRSSWFVCSPIAKNMDANGPVH